MSNTVLKCHALITSITINGNVKVPDGNNLITVPSADASALFRGMASPYNFGPIATTQVPTDPTT